MSGQAFRGMAVDRIIAFFKSGSLALLLFHLGVLLFSWPVLSLSAEEGGTPLFGYLFLAWSAVVILLTLVGLSLGRDQDKGA